MNIWTTIILLLICFLLFLNRKKLKLQNQKIAYFYELRETFVNANRSLIYLKDEKLNYVFVNKAFEEFWDKKSSDIIGQNDFSFMKGSLAEQIQRMEREVLEQRASVVDEVRWKGKVYQTHRFPVKISEEHYGVGAYIRDVTEEYNNRRLLEKNLSRNSILVELLTRNYQSTQEQLDYVLNETIKLTESKYGYIYLYDEEKEEFALNSWSKDVMPHCSIVNKKTIYQLDKTGIWGEVVRQRKPIIVNDFQRPNPLKKGYPEGHVQLTRFMSIPVFIDGHIVAVVGLANKEEDYDEFDIYQVTALMHGVWNAKERRERTIELEKTNEALNENQTKLRVILDSTAEAIFGVDMEGNCTFCNTSCLRILGYKNPEELIGKQVHWLVHHSRKDGSSIPLEECKIFSGLYKGQGVHADDEVFWRTDGTCFDVEYNSYPQYRDGEMIGAVITFSDITERKKAESEILYLSYHDTLTGLYNRRLFDEELIRLDSKENLPISIIMGDVNGLKLTNDIFGHNAGDLLLQKAAEVMKKGCRADDIIVRSGGDEFVILLPKCQKQNAEGIAKRIRNLFSQVQIEGLSGSISLGCATKNSEEEDLKKVIENAEERMYAQKTLDRKTFNYSAIESIIKTLHKRSPREEGHSRRVSELCQSIGRAMNLSEEEIRSLKYAGFLHDIGKIVLKDDLLNKKGKLSKQEYRGIMQHPVVGYRILSSSEETLELSQYVLSHHERWDGLGCPKGLKGEEIPKLARIIAIAEVFDALTHGLTYNQPVSREEALLEIKRKSGLEFDPDMVKILLEIMEPYGEQAVGSC